MCFGQSRLIRQRLMQRAASFAELNGPCDGAEHELTIVVVRARPGPILVWSRRHPDPGLPTCGRANEKARGVLKLVSSRP
jgi:hypothetical protein